MTSIGLRRDDHGVSTVEFALVAPLLLLLLIGILDLARIVTAYVVVSNASQEGAHFAMLSPGAAPSAIASAVRARAAPLDTSTDKLCVSASYYDGSTFQPWPSAGIPASSPQPSSIPVRVEVRYPSSAVTVLIGRFLGGAVSTTCPLPAGTTYFSSTTTVGTRR